MTSHKQAERIADAIAPFARSARIRVKPGIPKGFVGVRLIKADSGIQTEHVLVPIEALERPGEIESVFRYLTSRQAQKTPAKPDRR